MYNLLNKFVHALPLEETNLVHGCRKNLFQSKTSTMLPDDDEIDVTVLYTPTWMPKRQPLSLS